MSALAYALAHGVAGHAELFEPRAQPLRPLACARASTVADDLAALFAAPVDREKARRDGAGAALAFTKDEQAAVAAEVKSVMLRPASLRYDDLPCLQGVCSLDELGPSLGTLVHGDTRGATEGAHTRRLGR